MEPLELLIIAVVAVAALAIILSRWAGGAKYLQPHQVRYFIVLQQRHCSNGIAAAPQAILGHAVDTVDLDTFKQNSRTAAAPCA